MEVQIPFRVLSLDVGGIRGLYSASFLDNLCTQYAISTNKEKLDLGKGFDLIAGTSTGAIVGCAIAIGIPLSTVIELFIEKGKEIFPNRIDGLKSIFCRQLFRRDLVKKGDEALKHELKKAFGEKTFAEHFQERGIALSIPAINMSSHNSWVFKVSETSGPRDKNYKLADACLASSAAPIYRSLAKIQSPALSDPKQQIFVDGGLWANNPVVVAFIDAIMITKWKRPIEIFSLGTCPEPGGEEIENITIHRSILDWMFGAKIAPLSIFAQQFALNNEARFFAEQLRLIDIDVRVIRFPNAPVPKDKVQYLGLDDTRKEAMKLLTDQAQIDAKTAREWYESPNEDDDTQLENGKRIKALLESLPIAN